MSDELISDFDAMIVDAPVDFVGTGTMDSHSDKEEKDWENLVASVRAVEQILSDHAQRGEFLMRAENERDKLRAENEALRECAKSLIGVIEYHDLASLDCDRRGDEWCECLEKAVGNLKRKAGIQ